MNLHSSAVKIYSGSQESEVWGRVLCPMPYALCPMPYEHLMLLIKAIILIQRNC